MIYLIIGFVGLTMIINLSKYSLRLQNFLARRYDIISNLLAELLHCSMCAGFWIGIIEGILYWHYNLLPYPAGIIILGMGGLNSLLSTIAAKYIFGENL